MAPTPSQSNTDEHWKKTTRLMLIYLGVWFSSVTSSTCSSINLSPSKFQSGFPLGLHGCSGLVIVFVVSVHVCKTEDKIDREFGMAEDD